MLLRALKGERFSSRRSKSGWRVTIILSEGCLAIVEDYMEQEEEAVLVREDGRVYSLRGSRYLELGVVSGDFYEWYRQYLREKAEELSRSEYPVKEILEPLEKALGRWIVYP